MHEGRRIRRLFIAPTLLLARDAFEDDAIERLGLFVREGRLEGLWRITPVNDLLASDGEVYRLDVLFLVDALAGVSQDGRQRRGARVVIPSHRAQLPDVTIHYLSSS